MITGPVGDLQRAFVVVEAGSSGNPGGLNAGSRCASSPEPVTPTAGCAGAEQTDPTRYRRPDGAVLVVGSGASGCQSEQRWSEEEG
jgi:hypothetical protein